jgi:hypothetical protein
VAQLGGQGQGQPIIIMPEGSSRVLGRDAQRMNIMPEKYWLKPLEQLSAHEEWTKCSWIV